MSIATERTRLILAEDWQHPVLRSCIEQLVADNERLEKHVVDLQSGMYVNCVYCGHRYGPGETTPVSMADALKAHVAQCPEHPMAACVIALREAENAMQQCIRVHDSLYARLKLPIIRKAIANATGGTPS